MARSQWLRAVALAGGLMIATVGCKKEEAKTPPAPGTPGAPVAVDQSSPKATAKTFTTAVKSGDYNAAKAVVSGTDDQKKMFDQMAPAQNALIKLVDAANAKFGKDNDVAKAFKNVDHTADVDAAEVKEEGDKATLTAKGDDEPLHLVKKDGKWAVDLSEITKKVPAGLDFSKMTKAATETIEDINSGKAKSATEAMQSFGMKMMGGNVPSIPSTPTPSTPTTPAVPSTPSIPSVPTPPG